MSNTTTLLASVVGAPLSAATGLQEAATDIALLRPTSQRSIGTLLPQVVVKERHTDELEMTDHPVEAGATITDHAFKLPAMVVIECGFGQNGNSVISNYVDQFNDETLSTVVGAVVDASPLGIRTPVDLKNIYDQLLKYQDPPTLLDVTTGKRLYTNMLLKSLVVETDVENENVLKVTATLRQVLIVTTQAVTVGAPAEDQAEPESTQPTVDTGQKSLQEYSYLLAPPTLGHVSSNS